MNFKKFISGISALTIAASAFAGMAVTASAATKTTVTPIFGTVNADKTVSPETFEDMSTATGWAFSEDNGHIGNYTTKEVRISDTSLTGAVSGKALDVYARHNSKDSTGDSLNADYAFAETVSTGKITLSGDFRINTKYGYKVQLIDSTNNAVISINAKGTDNGNTTHTHNSNLPDESVTDEVKNSFTTYGASKNADVEISSLVVDLDNNTVSYDITWPRVDGTTATSTGSIAIAENSNIAALRLVTTNPGRNVYGSIYVDNLALYKSVSETLDYFLTTEPYAKVTVGNDVYYSAADGSVAVGELENGAAIVAEKDGYVTANDTVDLDNGNEIVLTPETGITYKESFDYVKDDFGGVSSNTTISSDGLKFTVASDNLKSTAKFPKTIDVSDKLITIEVAAYAVNTRNSVSLILDGITTSKITYSSAYNENKWRVNDSMKTDETGNSVDEYHLLQFYKDASLNRLSLYMDGKYCGVLGGVTSNILEGFTIDAINYNSGYKTKVNIKSITVANKPTDVSVKIGDADAVTYLAGTEITLPTPDEGNVWSADGTTAVASNTVTVTGDATYAQIADPSIPTDGAEVTAVSYNQYDAAYTGDTAVTAAKVLVTVTGSITKLGLKYNKGTTEAEDWTEAQYANDLTVITNGNILLGAILPGTLAPTTESFKAVID